MSEWIIPFSAVIFYQYPALCALTNFSHSVYLVIPRFWSSPYLLQSAPARSTLVSPHFVHRRFLLHISAQSHLQCIFAIKQDYNCITSSSHEQKSNFQHCCCQVSVRALLIYIATYLYEPIYICYTLHIIILIIIADACVYSTKRTRRLSWMILGSNRLSCGLINHNELINS